MSASPESQAPASKRPSVRLLQGHLGLAMLRFGLPLVIGMVLHTLFNLVDLFMISRLPNATAALAALAICDMVAAVATILSNGISTASVALISRHAGAGHLTALRRATYHSLGLVAFMSLLFGLAGIFGSEWIVTKMMFAKGETAQIAIPYLQVMLGGCFAIFLLLQLTAILRALGHAKTAASLLVGGNALNILLNVFFIYGSGPSPDVFAWGQPIAEAFGIPRMGVQGAAWATLVGRSVPVAIGLWLLLRRRGGPRFHRIYVKPDWGQWWSILKIGWPNSAQLVLRVGALLFVIGIINAEFTTDSDPSAMSAYSICLRLETLALFIAMGWGAAASSFVGTNLGAGLVQRARNAGLVATFYNAICTLALAGLYLTYAGPLVAFFDPNPTVVAIGREYVEVVALSYVLLGAGIVLSQAMTGAGATLSSLVLDTVVVLMFLVPAAYIVAVTLGLARRDLWQVLAFGNLVSAVVYALYYARGSFLHKRI